jgi:hypothetical protein
MIFLGALDIDQGESIALDIRLGADAATVQAAILKANAERAAAAKRESEHLQKLFLDKVAIERGEKGDQ